MATNKSQRQDDHMLSVSVQNNYIVVAIKNKIIKSLASPALSKYTAIKSFDREDGVLTLIGQMNLLNGKTVLEEDWIDLNETLGFAFKDPQKIIRKIDSVQLL